MADCCDPRGCDREFDDRFARRTAAEYRAKGLSRSAEAMVAALERRGIRDASVLEIGGGVGAIHLELLRRGAATATNLELSPAYDAEARRLAAEAGLAGRVTRRIADLAVDPDAAQDADVVVLHRVVCCYPDYARLLGAAASRARRLLVFSYPPRNLLTRGVVAADAARGRLVGREYRAFAHPPEDMLGVLEEAGMTTERIHRDLAWRAALAERPVH